MEAAQVGVAVPRRSGVPVGALALSALTLSLWVGGLALVYLAMRAVMAVGGACASGGPYEVAVECPNGVWMLPVGVVGGLIALFCFAGAAGRLGGHYGSLGSLAWPALFLSLGWSFAEFGIDAPGEQGIVASWLFCAALFALMGGVPLALGLRSGTLRRAVWPAGVAARPLILLVLAVAVATGIAGADALYGAVSG